MQLYAGSSKQFVEDTVQSRIADKLKNEFFAHYRYEPSPNEVRAWQNSLSRLCNVIQYARLDDQGVLLEYQLPLTSKRLDAMFTGHDDKGGRQAVIVELKQWVRCAPSDVEDQVLTFIGGGMREMLHPSRQVGQYMEYLADNHTVFHEGGVGLSSCAYLHNLSRAESDDEVFAERHAALLAEYPTFAGDDASALSEFVTTRVGGGRGMEVLEDVRKTSFRASKKLLEHTAAVIAAQREYVLLDEQLVVFNTVMAKAREGTQRGKKQIVLVRGGPGTGKSVIALHLVGKLSAEGLNAHYATGSKAFTENMRRIVGKRSTGQFKYFADYITAKANDVDVLICDEAHRMWATGNTRFTPAAQRSKRALIEDVVGAARVTVFFIDDLQVVRPKEVGSAALVRETADKLRVPLMEIELEAQFRCAGSDGFVNWVDNTLGVRKTANILWQRDEAFDFRVFDDPASMTAALRERVAAGGQTGRLVAGFCWPWSDPNPDGTLVKDVVVGDWSMPWNAKDKKVKLQPGIPKSDFWASDPGGFGQVGCIYTAQGFEFDYVGVIVGRDLRYDPATNAWVGDPAASEDKTVARSKDDFLANVKNSYRVLMTRGLKGCFVCFVDPATKSFVRSRME